MIKSFIFIFILSLILSGCSGPNRIFKSDHMIGHTTNGASIEDVK